MLQVIVSYLGLVKILAVMAKLFFHKKVEKVWRIVIFVVTLLLLIVKTVESMEL